ncbi:response regulator transcription factor [Alkalicoccobacillus porphyridii]|uniref:Response regulator transcription factor n=1 Tax=Alkalicoccobacillus porphyridii TaxID=2597270 RepID=A0A553ZXN7_9BACI|nr:response regulator transcription factor [Alkalicoccobacillus porphyridii]TSB46220.1 response regulator transcription factor [Alkalicoccobacillus porphyridii]
MEHILIVDDEVQITSIVGELLYEEGYKTTVANEGMTAIKLIKEQNYDLIILDVMMPYVNGLEVCKSVREFTDVPILFVTAKTSVNDQINGLNVGGDDYINKPFTHEQLLARIKTHLRRERRTQQQSHELVYGKIKLDCRTNELYYEDTPLVLTNKEFLIMEMLMRNPRHIFSKDHLYESIWGLEATGQAHTVTEHIRNIRIRIHKVDPMANLIHTVWGVGYKLE